MRSRFVDADNARVRQATPTPTAKAPTAKAKAPTAKAPTAKTPTAPAPTAREYDGDRDRLIHS